VGYVIGIRILKGCESNNESPMRDMIDLSHPFSPNPRISSLKKCKVTPKPAKYMDAINILFSRKESPNK
jgi:hypothetical protein